MSGSAAQKLEALNIELPESKPVPGALYLPFKVSGNTVYVSGQLPSKDGALVATGPVGSDVSQEDAQKAAEVCAINVLACLKSACNGDLDKVKQTLKLEILVAVSPDFTNPQLVANGASKLIKDVLGEEKGAHARVAYGVASLPMGASVEVAATFELA
jgi:enamine deaminase RidA (YjgF/YER057c/UK114 family)